MLFVVQNAAYLSNEQLRKFNTVVLKALVPLFFFGEPDHDGRVRHRKRCLRLDHKGAVLSEVFGQEYLMGLGDDDLREYYHVVRC